ncbi:hypothetical protein Psi01_84420 [Planobispora siamensis]|uniref:Uncharacterized protein n=1 Tax=Planobispora siamensis TaxID=936338 RepID=A0A8J3SS19_9ACTN|nr:hypothetical protein Psi01_84420 [Planobispora siamensis]
MWGTATAPRPSAKADVTPSPPGADPVSPPPGVIRAGPSHGLCYRAATVSDPNSKSRLPILS